MKHSLCITPGDEENLSLDSKDTRRRLQNDCSTNKASSAIFSVILAVSLALIIGAVATVGYYNHFASNTSSTAAADLHRRSPSGKLIIGLPVDEKRPRRLKEHIEKRSLQRFGDGGDSPVTTSSAMTEEPVIHNYGFAGVSDADVHKMLYGGYDEGGDKRENVIPMANDQLIVEVDSVIIDETENNVVLVDQAASARRRNAIAVKQALVKSGEQLKILFMNTIDVQPGDFVALVPFRVDTSAGLSDDDYIAYAYVCKPGSDPIFDCPKYGTVVWDVGTNISSGRYKAILSKEDGPEPYTIKAETNGPFMIQGANRAEVVESPTPAPPTISPPIENSNHSLDTV